MVSVLLFLLNKMSIFGMFNTFLKLYHYFSNEKFELAHIGDLSSYSYDELCIQLNYFKKTVKLDRSFMIVTWESARTILTIKYDLDKKFIKKVGDVWK
jgi:hypothetical protein